MADSISWEPTLLAWTVAGWTSAGLHLAVAHSATTAGTAGTFRATIGSGVAVRVAHPALGFRRVQSRSFGVWDGLSCGV